MVVFSKYRCSMSKEFLKFSDIEIEKWKFHSSKSPTVINDENINQIKKSNKCPCKKCFIKKHFIFYRNDEIIMPRCTLPPKMNLYVKDF